MAFAIEDVLFDFNLGPSMLVLTSGAGDARQGQGDGGQYNLSALPVPRPGLLLELK